MKRRLVILTEIIAPYRIPLFNALASYPEVDLHVIFLAETDPSLRQWQTYKEEIGFSYQVLPSWRRRIGRYNALLNRSVASALSKAQPEIVLCGGYNYIASWQTLFWARCRKIPFFLWSESNAQDLRRGLAPVEFLKSEFLQQCAGFVVPGRSAREYLEMRGVRGEDIFVAPNAVDNKFFAEAAGRARAEAERKRLELNLPDRYFLFSGRLVRPKGVFELLSAYANLEPDIRSEFGLVYAGDGLCKQELEQKSLTISPGRVQFVGFAQREQLAIYYALAKIFVLPTYTDPWGLVVNEAMACGLPVIVSQVAGCSVDLLTDHWNGLLVPPMDVLSLTSAMRVLAVNPHVCATMGFHSEQRVSEYSPQAWADAIAGITEGSRKRKRD